MAADYLTFVSGRSVSPLRARNNAGLKWLFRNRQTGEITVFSAANALGIFLAWSIISVLLGPSGRSGTALTLTAAPCALAVGAADEWLRGVNPFPRALGAGCVVWAWSSFTF